MGGAKAVLSFKQFLLRQQSINLYRDLLRATREIDDQRQKEELRTWIRGEFDKWKSTTDEDTIKLLLTQGRQTVRELRCSLQMTK